MAGYNKNKASSMRAQWWDYGWNGTYFITICTANRNHFFGEIVDKKIKLSHAGVIANLLWHDIPHRCKHVELGDFVIMPNHLHGILILDRADHDPPDLLKDSEDSEIDIPDNETKTLPLEWQWAPPEEYKRRKKMSEISPKAGSVSVIVRSYKSAVTKHANRLGFANGWQSLFHDHIIRNQYQFMRISRYIQNNPKNWKEDRLRK